MAIERRNPLPVGSYWQDIVYDRLAGFDQWLRRYPETVRVDATEEREGAEGSPSLTWYAFSVLSPTPWEGPGYPTIIPAGTRVTSASDVVQRPVAVDPVAELQSAAVSGLKLGVGALVVVIGLQLIGKAKR